MKNAKSKDGFLKSYVYPEYQYVQKQRWISENATEDVTGGQWERLNPVYETYKKKKFASYPGSGSRLLIAKSNLLPSVVGESKDSRVLIQDGKLGIFSSLPYASYVNEKRPFDTFSSAWRKKISEAWAQYIAGKPISARS
jgi:hypothetical protein